jgi:hypothetical protein
MSLNLWYKIVIKADAKGNYNFGRFSQLVSAEVMAPLKALQDLCTNTSGVWVEAFSLTIFWSSAVNSKSCLITPTPSNEPNGSVP